MSLQGHNEGQKIQSASALAKGFAHLSVEDRASLLEIIGGYEKSLAESKEMLKQVEAAASKTAETLKNVRAQLVQSRRELEVETALDRVRYRTMAMQNSSDVADAIGVLFTELEGLGIVTLRCGIFIIDEVSWSLEVWTAATTKEGKVGQAGGRFPANIHPMVANAVKAWKAKEAFYTYELAGEELKRYFQLLLAANPGYHLPAHNLDTGHQFSSGFFFNEGALFTFTSAPHPPENIGVLQRFAAVFGLTYRRYLDLRTAEEQACRAVKQASLDRVRAEIASMRSAGDLQRITPTVWRELKALQVPFGRCGVFIVEEEAGLIHAYLSTPEGHSRGVLHIPIDKRRHVQLLLKHWHNGTIYSEHWRVEEFREWMAYLNALEQNSGAEKLWNEAGIQGSLYLHFLPFSKGMLYVGNTTPLTTGELELVHSLAGAFAMAYDRYEDFRKLEEAKNKMEVTLADLRTAQQQLIQSEKMASLGELTAGIAHEIQNPLNFVNNFAETTEELLNEMEEALQKGNSGEAAALAEEIKQNLGKISHHGRRADSIVRGMLQHSRKSNGQKLPVNINELVDEYLRLSYHGYRAKDKSFNAKLQTRFDRRIGKADVIAQDIGRVLLNLFNNAFYAVHEKKKDAGEQYEPCIQVMTRLDDDKIKIRVKDNGTGIQPKARAKLFQPFFTTKPSGEGTGLGLSICYDIVKMHGGELKVKSIPGEETEFTIVLNKEEKEGR